MEVLMNKCINNNNIIFINISMLIIVIIQWSFKSLIYKF